MRIFFLDIASKEGTLACVTQDEVVSMRTTDTKISDTDLPALMQDVWKEAGWSAKDLTHVACVTGPGGFMSLRVGVASANALAWALGLPVTGIRLSDLYAARMKTFQGGTHNPDALWLHSTKKEELFVRGFGKLDVPWRGKTHIRIQELQMKPGTLWMGELIPEQRAAVDAMGGKPAELETLKKTLPLLLSSIAYVPGQLEPWYGREG